MIIARRKILAGCRHSQERVLSVRALDRNAYRDRGQTRPVRQQEAGPGEPCVRVLLVARLENRGVHSHATLAG